MMSDGSQCVYDIFRRPEHTPRVITELRRRTVADEKATSHEPHNVPEGATKVPRREHPYDDATLAKYAPFAAGAAAEEDPDVPLIDPAAVEEDSEVGSIGDDELDP